MPYFLQTLFPPNYAKLEDLVDFKSPEAVSERIHYLQRIDPDRLKIELSRRDAVGHTVLHSTMSDLSDSHQKEIALLNAGADPYLPFPGGGGMIFHAIVAEKINEVRLLIWHGPYYEHLKLPASAIGFFERINHWHVGITVLEAIEKWDQGSQNLNYQRLMGSDGDIKGILCTITEDAKAVHAFRQQAEIALVACRYQEAIDCCEKAAELCDKQAAIESEIPYPRYDYEIASRPHLVKQYHDHGIAFREKIAVIYLQWEKALGVKVPSVDNFSVRIQLIEKLLMVCQNLGQSQKIKQYQNYLKKLNQELQNFRAINLRPVAIPVKQTLWNRFRIFGSRPTVARLPEPSQEALCRLAPSTARPYI